MRLHTVIEGKPRAFDVTPRFEETCDAVVVGLGTAGATALICLARSGLRALGVERSTGMGGMGGLGCVWDYFYGCRGGFQEEISRACDCVMASGRCTTTQRPGLPEQSFPGAVRSRVMERMAREAGAELMYESQPVGVFMEGDRVTGVRCAGPDGMRDLACRVLIDGTAEADAAWLAGCEMLPNRLSDGATQFFSLPYSRLVDGEYTIGSWFTAAHIDCADAGEQSRRILEITRQWADVRENERAHTVYQSPLLGNREGRRIRGRTVLTLSGLLAGQKTEQPLFYAHSPVDTFNRDLALEDESIQDFRSLCDLGNVILSVGVPMQALLPCRVEGMIVIGRCLSVDHDLAACVRMMRDMQKSGEAAALMAKESIRTGLPLPELPYELLRGPLTESGCLNGAQDAPWVEGCRWSHQERDGMAIRWPEGPREMRELLAQPFASGALWACRQDPKRWQGDLLRWLNEGEETLSWHCALALAFDRHPSALPWLRERALRAEGEAQGAEEVRKAVCLLGRYAQAEDIPLFFSILRRPRPQGEADPDQFSLLFLQATASLVRTLRAHPACRAPRDELLRLLYAPDFSLILRRGPVDLTAACRELCAGL